MREKIDRFMQGRYGMDQFSRVLLWIAVVFAVLSMFIRFFVFDLITILFLFLVYFRILSRDRERRYQENQRFLAFCSSAAAAWGNRKAAKEQQKLYLICLCPKCGQKVRVPRGKGAVEISCPKCKERFRQRS